MMRKFGVSLLVLAVLALNAAEPEIVLVKPDMTGGKPLMQLLAERSSGRTFSGEALTDQQLSDILFAAWGVNRKDGRRTVPTARNVQDMVLFAALPGGLYRYDGAKHALQLVLDQDLRKFCGMQGFHKKAPVVLIYVSDIDKYTACGMTEKDAAFYGPIHAGSIAQSVYLAASSHGLNTVVCNAVDKSALGRAMKLGPQYRIMLTQPVGAPAK